MKKKNRFEFVICIPLFEICEILKDFLAKKIIILKQRSCVGFNKQTKKIRSKLFKQIWLMKHNGWETTIIRLKVI